MNRCSQAKSAQAGRDVYSSKWINIKRVLSWVVVIYLGFAGSALAQQIINIDATQNGQEFGDQGACCTGPLINPVIQPVDAGDYTLTSAFGQPGAVFGAWNYNLSYADSWVWGHWKIFFLDNQGGSKLLVDVGGTEHFATQAEAAAYGLQHDPVSISVPAAGKLAFVVNDYYLADNAGGVSVRFSGKCDLPTGEITSVDHWGTGRGQTVLGFAQTLTGQNAPYFEGRKVREVFGGSGHTGEDKCWFPGSKIDPLSGITHGEWTVDDNNMWGDDSIGWNTIAVRYYRHEKRVPCETYFTQQMQIECAAGSGDFKNYGPPNILKVKIDKRTVYSERAGVGEKKRWP